MRSCKSKNSSFPCPWSALILFFQMYFSRNFLMNWCFLVRLNARSMLVVILSFILTSIFPLMRGTSLPLCSTSTSSPL